MVFAKIYVTGTCARVTELKKLTSGLAGGEILVDYEDHIWAGLSKAVVFRGIVEKDVLTDNTAVEIPWEVLDKPCKRLWVGFYGTDSDKNMIIPTVYADLGPVLPGADPSGDESTDPSLPVWAQLQNQIDDLRENGYPDDEGGKPGENGGYYTPSVKQPNSDTLQFAFAPSKAGMPAIDPVEVALPAGPNGDDYTLTEADKNEIAEMAADLVEVPDSGGIAVTDSLNDRKKKNTFAMVSFVDDDCREEVFTKLWPVIQEKGIPYTLACAPYDIGRVTDEYRFLRLEDELLPMYKAGVKIACHHYKQQNMDTFATEADYRADLQACKEAFVQMGINDVDTICYPQGVVVDDYLKTIKEFNRIGFTVNRGINQIPFETYHMKRCEVFSTHGLWTLDDAKDYVDQLELEGGWLIFMTHAWYSSFDPVGLGDLIDYVTGKDIPIVDIPTAIETNGNIIEVGRFRKPIGEMHEPFFVADASGAVWTNSVNTVAQSTVKVEILNVKYNTGTYLKPGGGLSSHDDVKRCVTVDIPAAPGERYRITGSAVWGGAIYAVYNQDGGVEEVRTSANTENGECLIDHEITMPANTAYFRVSFNKTKYPDQFAVKKLTSIPGNINGDGNYGGNVAYDKPQNLTDEQKAQARENIGAQPAGNYLTEVPDGYAKKEDIPTDEEIIQLIEEHAPESSGGGISVTGAKVGQTVKISAVDENGVPTAWESVDFPSGGSGGENWELIQEVEITESDVTILEIQGLSLKKLVLTTPPVPTTNIVTENSGMFKIYVNNAMYGTIGNLFRQARSISSVYVEALPYWTTVFASPGDDLSIVGSAKYNFLGINRTINEPITSIKIDNSSITYGVGAKFYLYGVRV